MEVKASNQITLMNTDLVDAAKTATNYLSFSSDGLVVGDLTGSTLGKNVLIDSDSVDIRSGNTVLASFEANKISLGIDSMDSTIDLCGGKGTIYVHDYGSADSSIPSLVIESEDLVICVSDPSDASKYASMFYSSTSDDAPYLHMIANSEANNAIIYSDVINNRPRIYLRALDGNQNESSLTITNSTISLTRSALCHVELHDDTVHIQANDRLTVDSQAYFNSTIQVDSSAYMNDSLKVSGDIYVGSNNIQITGSNKVLWSGQMCMYASQTATLSEAISAQVNGIVLVFCAWDASSQTLQQWDWNHIYIPKQDIVYNNTTGHTMALFKNGLGSIAYKYLYISDTTIKGHDNNGVSGTANGITYNNTKFVLRYVIGV